MFLMAANTQESKPWGLPSVFKRFGFMRSTQKASTTAAQPNSDGYLLVLLADQELAAGRQEQARSLLDAAYDAFDQATGEGRNRTDIWR
jgi:hypothetical protein